MTKGEKAILRCRSDYAYGKQAQNKIPADSTLNFDVELISFGPKKKESWELSDEEKAVSANQLKESGTKAFQAKDFQQALADYCEAAELVGSDSETLEAIYLACKLNCAQACLSLGDYASAAAHATEVLKKDSTNIKALYRRGVARNHLGLSEEAIVDLEAVLAVDPDNKAAKVELVKSKKAIADAKKKAKAIYGNFFSKVSVYDDKEAPVVAGLSKDNPKVSSLLNYSI